MVVNNLDVGGLEKVVLSLLGEMDPSSFELSLVCLKGAGAMHGEVRLPPERVLVLDPDTPVNLGVARVDVSALVSLRRFFKRIQPDVVHAHNFAPLIYGGIAAWSLRPRPRVVYSEHNQVNSASARDLMKFRHYAKLADEIVAVSDDLGRTLRNRLGINRPLRVIKNGIDGRRFRCPKRDEARRALGVLDDELLIGTAVVLSKQKGISDLLEAARLLRSRLPRAKFAVAGDGPLREKLEAEAVAKGVSDLVRFLGYRSDIPDLLAAFDIYVLPSLWEGLPLALVEALSLGKPIVCTDVGGNREVIVDGLHGFLVPPADPPALADRLFHVANDEAFRARAGSDGPLRFQTHFSLSAMARRHEELFVELAGESKKTRIEPCVSSS